MYKSSFDLLRCDGEGVSDIAYDCAFFALGYESRATALLRKANVESKRKLAIGFDYGKCLAYAENLSIFRARGFAVLEDVQDERFQSIVSDALRMDLDRPARVLVDISCFNRYRLACIVDALGRYASDLPIEVYFYYSLARFSNPPHAFVPNSVVNPVHSGFAGWSATPATPTSAIVGLGYEQDQALGIVEYLQANPVWLFSPASGETRYLPAVRAANEFLLEELPPTNVVSYTVEEPVDAFRLLEGMARGLLHDHNVVIVPFGPKVFVLCSLLVAWRCPAAAVWRVSPGKQIEPQNRHASRHYSMLRLVARPS